MLDLLKRFEEDGLDDPFANPQNDDDDGGGDDDDLERRLAGIDLESASEDKIWAALSPEERARFTRAVQDPASELAKALLSKFDLAGDVPTPWWVASSSTLQANAPASRSTLPPEVMAIPESLLAAPTSPSPAPTFPLAYNLVSILAAYAYASRHLCAYPLAASSPEARTLVSRLAPFLVARDDKTRFPGIESAATDLFSRFDAGAITPPAFALLLRDAATLLHSPLVVTEEDSEPVPALRALSDLHALFAPSAPRAAAKVMFYAAHVHRASAPFLRALGADAERWAAKLEKEGESGVVPVVDAASSSLSQKQVGQQVPRDDRRGAPLVVELS